MFACNHCRRVFWYDEMLRLRKIAAPYLPAPGASLVQQVECFCGHPIETKDGATEREALTDFIELLQTHVSLIDSHRAFVEASVLVQEAAKRAGVKVT